MSQLIMTLDRSSHQTSGALSSCEALNRHRSQLSSGVDSHYLGAAPRLIGEIPDSAIKVGAQAHELLYPARLCGQPYVEEANEEFLHGSLLRFLDWVAPKQILVFNPYELGWNTLRAVRARFPDAHVSAVFTDVPDPLTRKEFSVGHSELSLEESVIRHALYQDAISMLDGVYSNQATVSWLKGFLDQHAVPSLQSLGELE